MELKIEPKTVDEKTVILKLSGEMDIYSAPKLKEQAADLIKEGKSRLLLEMTELKYIDSSGLGVLVAAMTRAKENGGVLCLISPTRPVCRLLEIIGLDQILKCYPNVEDAIKAI